VNLQSACDVIATSTLKLRELSGYGVDQAGGMDRSAPSRVNLMRYGSGAQQGTVPEINRAPGSVLRTAGCPTKIDRLTF
jgi:hypothetical protein